VSAIRCTKDIYSAWKEWSILETNTKWFQALDTVGGEPTVAGQFWTLHTFNKWMEDKTISGSYSINIIGNIFDLDGGEKRLA
jgi:hypothetical protein